MSRRPAFAQRALGDGLTGASQLLLDAQSKPLLEGRLVTAEFSAASSVSVKHGLQRRYNGALVIAQNTGTRVFIVQRAADGTDPDNIVKVFAYDWAGANTAVTANVDLWVF